MEQKTNQEMHEELMRRLDEMHLRQVKADHEKKRQEDIAMYGSATLTESEQEYVDPWFKTEMYLILYAGIIITVVHNFFMPLW